MPPTQDGQNYYEPTSGAAKAPQATGAGNNPSTWAGVLVLGAVALLLGARSSFRRFM